MLSVGTVESRDAQETNLKQTETLELFRSKVTITT